MSMWLAFFEDWLVTDVWSGGGIHPNVKEPEKPGSGENAIERGRLSGIEGARSLRVGAK